MTNATSGPRACGPQDTTTLQPTRQASQAATRAAYIARVVSEAPPISEDVLDRLAVLLRPVSLGAAA